MSVVTRNPFALLDDDDSSSTPETTTAAPAAAEAAPTASAARSGQRGRGGGPASRAGRYYQRGGAKSGQRDGDAPAEGESEAAPKKFDGERRGRGRGGRGESRGRGGREGGGGGREGGGGGGARGRAFDRHSGTGLNDSDKKMHQGWGGDDGPTELAVVNAAATDAAVEAVGGDWAGSGDAAAVPDAWAVDATPTGAPAEDVWAVPSADVPAPEANGMPASDSKRSFRDRERERDEDEDLVTFEEYQAQKAKLDEALVPKLEVRKANDGAGDQLFKGAVKLAKGEEEDAYFAGKSKSAHKPRAKKEEKVVIEIEARFERPRSDRGVRGGRGGDRGFDRGGGRGRGGDRDRGGDRGGPRGRGRGRGDGPPSAPPVVRNGPRGNVDVNDQSAFPSLA